MLLSERPAAPLRQVSQPRLVWLATVHRLRRGWPALLVAAISGGVLSALLWQLIHLVANTL
ncbi:hypothetical protein [Plantactinospora mayteni]|uniref:hypothetical protein n=1 Tax=Plantactinospora mayteni TaxID=566021 RepID=UPI001940E2BC|nr:hypothetical protein [Plantactinospora mayteni]